MIVSWIIYGFAWIILRFDFTENVVINGSNLRSLTCFGINSTEEHCRVLGRAVTIPERLLDIYKSQKTRIRNALDTGELFSLTGQDLLSIHPVLILLIPSTELSQIGGDKLGLLLTQWSNENAIVRHILSAASINDSMTKFLKRVESIQMNNDVLDMIGESLVTDFSARILGPVLPHLSFSFLVNLTTIRGSKMLFFFKPLINGKGSQWHLKSQLIQRVWAKITIDCNYPMPINQWRDNTIETMGVVLLGAKPSELNQINGVYIADKIGFLTLQFSKIQIRALFPRLYKNIRFTERDFKDLDPVLVYLLPSQLQMLPSVVTDYKNMLILPTTKSVAIRNQIFEYLLVELKDVIPYGIEYMKNNDLLSFDGLVTLLPAYSLMDYANNPLDFDKLMPLQSKFLTQAQVYYLLGKGKDVNVSHKAIQNCFAYLHALPASKITKEMGAKTVSHLALHMPTENVPRLIHFLYEISPTLGSNEVMFQLIEYPERMKIFDLLPIRLLINRIKKLTQFMSVSSSDLMPLPKRMASLMYRSLINVTMNSHSESQSFVNNLVYGFNCQDISDLPVPDFILTVSKFRKILKSSNEEFPKELQHCIAEKLVDYLYFKSFVIQQNSDETLIDLLGPAEIEAVGGCVLLKLPIEYIKGSKYQKNIIQQIGRMSQSELLVAAPMTKIRELIYSYLPGNNYTISSEELTILGNLTMLMDEELIHNVHLTPFKLLLEGNYFDKRLCVTISQRNAWKVILLQSFGFPTNWTGEEMIIIGDMMITLPKEMFMEISEEAWVSAADILETRYLDSVQNEKEKTFFEMCESILPGSEANSYVSSIKTMLRFFLKAAQYQLDTVKNSESIQYANEVWNDNTQKSSENVSDDVESYSVASITGVSNNKVEYDNEFGLHYSSTTDTAGTTESVTETQYESTTTLSTEGIPSSQSNENNKFHDSNEHTSIDSIVDTNISESYSTVSVPTDTSDKKNDYPCDNEVLNEMCREESKINDSILEDATVIAPAQTETEFEDPGTTVSTETILTSVAIYRSESDVLEDSKGLVNAENYKEDVFQPLTLALKTKHTHEKVKLLDLLPDESHVYSSISEALEANLKNHKLNAHKHNNELPQDDMLIPLYGKDNYDSNAKEEVFDSLLQALQALNVSQARGHYYGQDVHESDMLIPLRNNDRNSNKIVNKRSLTDIPYLVSCDAIRTVGRPAELVITQDMINSLSDNEIKDCAETFSRMKLPKHIQSSIWSRMDKEDFHLKGELVAAAQVEDLLMVDFNMSHAWVLESIYALSKFNNYHSVGKSIVNHSTKKIKHLRIEEVAALGKVICLLPDLKSHLTPPVLLRSSVILGSSVKCNQSCLNTLANIAINDQAFGTPSTWSSFDVADLGIIVAGLSKTDWKILIEENSNALYGLQRSAGACMEETIFQDVPVNIIKKIPYFTRLSIVNRNLKWLTPENKTIIIQLDDVALNATKISPSASNNMHLPNLIPIYITVISIVFTVF